MGHGFDFPDGSRLRRGAPEGAGLFSGQSPRLASSLERSQPRFAGSMSMIFNLFRKSPRPDAALEALSLHCGAIPAATVLRRLGRARHGDRPLQHDLAAHGADAAPAEGRAGGAGISPRRWSTCFFRDMDHSHRELGVTDLGVPRKVKTMGNVFYGLVGSARLRRSTRRSRGGRDRARPQRLRRRRHRRTRSARGLSDGRSRPASPPSRRPPSSPAAPEGAAA